MLEQLVSVTDGGSAVQGMRVETLDPLSHSLLLIS